MASLRTALLAVPDLKRLLAPYRDGLLAKLSSRIDSHETVLDELRRGIVDDPPFTVREGG